MGPLHDAVRRVCVDLQAVLDAAERTGGAVGSSTVLSVEAQLSGLRLMEREMRSGPPSRRIWSFGQAAVPVLSSLLNGLARKSAAMAENEVARCRSSVSTLGDALIVFAEGREVLPINGADIELVIFDNDGVLVDSELLSITVIAELLQSAGMPLSVDEVGERFIGRTHDYVMASLTAEFGPPPDSVRDFETAVLAAFPDRLQPVRGMNEALSQIEQPICVGSNGGLDRVRLSLAIAGLDSCFVAEHVFSADMVAHAKPAPDLFLHAARTVGVDPAKCLVVEDSVVGVTAAVSAGMQVVGFVGGSHTSPPLAPLLMDTGAQLIIDSPRQLLELLAPTPVPQPQSLKKSKKLRPPSGP
ncbi:MAG: HAD family hydrolase [Acidimicrobiales bacterium]